MQSSLTFQSLTLNGRLKGCGNTISLYTGILYSTQCWKISARNDFRRAFQWGKRLQNLNSNLGAQDERGFTCDYISTEKKIYVTPPKLNIAPEKWWVGRLLSFPDGLFSGVKLPGSTSPSINSTILGADVDRQRLWCCHCWTPRRPFWNRGCLGASLRITGPNEPMDTDHHRPWLKERCHFGSVNKFGLFLHSISGGALYFCCLGPLQTGNCKWATKKNLVV